MIGDRRPLVNLRRGEIRSRPENLRRYLTRTVEPGGTGRGDFHLDCEDGAAKEMATSSSVTYVMNYGSKAAQAFRGLLASILLRRRADCYNRSK
jgi:hypothetical protein